MSDVASAALLMKQNWPAGKVGERILRAFKDLRRIDDRWTHSRVKDLWYEDAHRVDAWEMDDLRALVRQEQRETAGGHKETSDRLARLEAMVERLLAAQDRSSLAQAGTLA